MHSRDHKANSVIKCCIGLVQLLAYDTVITLLQYFIICQGRTLHRSGTNKQKNSIQVHTVVEKLTFVEQRHCTQLSLPSVYSTMLLNHYHPPPFTTKTLPNDVNTDLHTRVHLNPTRREALFLETLHCVFSPLVMASKWPEYNFHINLLYINKRPLKPSIKTPYY